jgi:uncharacterized protein YycO
VGAGFGNVLLYRSDSSLISGAICWQTRSIYCHAALLYPDGNTVIEAVQFRGVQKRQWNDNDEKRADIFEVEGMSDWQWRNALRFAEDELGCGYDYRSIFRFITRTDAGSDKRWFCSELVFAAIEFGNGRLLSRTRPWKVAPGHLALSPRLR